MAKQTAQFYVKIMGETQGPFTAAQIRALAGKGHLLPDSHVRNSKEGRWVTADSIKGLSFSPAKPQPTPIQSRSSTSKPQPDSKRPDRLKLVIVGACLFFFLTTLGLLAALLMRGETKPVAAVMDGSRQTSESDPRTTVPSPAEQQEATTSTERITTPVVKPDPTPVKTEPPKSSPNQYLMQIAKGWGVESLHVKKIGDIELLIGVKHSIGYIPKNYSYPTITGTELNFKIAFRTSAGETDEPSAGFILVNGRTEQLKIDSSNPDVVEAYEDGSAGVRGAGKSIVTFKCAGKKISIPIQVTTVPFNVGYGKSSPKEIIKALGIPQRKKSHIVVWPDSKSIDQMYYGPDAGSQRVGDHWEYDKLPGLAIRVVSTFVDEIGMRDRPSEYLPKIIRQ